MPKNVRDTLDEGAYAVRRTIGETVCALTADKMFQYDESMRLINMAITEAVDIAANHRI